MLKGVKRDAWDEGFRIWFEDKSKRFLLSLIDESFVGFLNKVSIATQLVTKYLVLFNHLKQSELCQIQLLTC